MGQNPPAFPRAESEEEDWSREGPGVGPEGGGREGDWGEGRRTGRRGETGRRMSRGKENGKEKGETGGNRKEKGETGETRRRMGRRRDKGETGGNGKEN